MIFHPQHLPKYLHNRGCGMSYLQRNHKVSYNQVDPDNWFIRENLCDKISIDAPWCLLEPEEGRFDWHHPEWEGCFQSWIDAGYKVILRARDMDTLGTFYNQGTPQWVFDAGAKYVDDPISLYRREKVLLNDIPSDGKLPVRYPVYWDPIYMEKAEKFIDEFGRRYNNNPAVEGVSIAHMGRWGEMHIGDWGPMEPWLEAGFSIDVYNHTLMRFIDIYRKAFPDKMLSLSIGRPALYPEYTYQDVMEVLDYAVLQEVMLKYDGLGCSFEPNSSPYLCKTVSDLFQKYRYKTKLSFENLVLPEALDEGISHGISYWQRGGETSGLRISRVTDDVSTVNKRIFSWYKFFSSKYDIMTQEQQKDCFRKMARKCGYRLALDSLIMSAEKTQPLVINWHNEGYAPCFEKFHILLGLFDYKNDRYVWQQNNPVDSSGNPQIWDVGKSVSVEVPMQPSLEVASGEYELHLGIKLDGFNKEMMQLPLAGKCSDGSYLISRIKI